MVSRRLLIVADSVEGGLGELAHSQAAWFASHDWEVALASGATDVSGSLLVYPLSLPPTALDVAGMRQAARELRAAQRVFRPDVVHCHGLRSFGIALLAGGRPFVTLHGTGTVPGEPLVDRAARRIALAMAPRIAPGAFVVAPDLLPRWRFLAHASSRLATFDLLPFPSEGTPTFLWLGRLALPKRPEMFIEALAIASRQIKMAGIVAGSGPLERRVRELACRLNVSVRFVGHASEIVPLLSESWAVVLLSWFEGLPLAIEEAMWAGRPVVSSRLPGPAWLLGECGTLANSVESVAEMLVRLADPDVARTLGEAAAERIRSVINVDDPWPALEAIYSEKINGQL